MCLTDLMLLADAYADASKDQSSSAQSPDAARAALVRALEAVLCQQTLAATSVSGDEI